MEPSPRKAAVRGNTAESGRHPTGASRDRSILFALKAQIRLDAATQVEVMHNDPSRVSVRRDRRFGHLAKSVTIYRNRRSRLTEMTGHDGPKYAAFQCLLGAEGGAP
jgi:hypothetical protein